MKYTPLLLLILVLGCSFFSEFNPTHEIASPNKILKAQIGYRSNDFWLKISKSENEVLFKEIYHTNYEVGIDNVQWKRDSSMFAIKLIGYDDWTQIKIFSLENGKPITIAKKEQLNRYQWLKLDLSYRVTENPTDHLEKYEI